MESGIFGTEKQIVVWQPVFLTFTDKKENKSFLIYKEIQSGAVAKSYSI
jgi:hypothetical protein